MDCPHCKALRVKPVQTKPADQRTDGTTWRRYICKQCDHSFGTLEVPTIEWRELQRRANSLPPPPPAQLDVGAELEKLLPNAITALGECMKEKKADKTKFDAAKWIVLERMAARAQKDPNATVDPAMAAIQALLAQDEDTE